MDDDEFDSYTTHCGPFVYRFRTLASQAGEMGSIPIRVTKEKNDQVMELVDIRRSERRALVAWEFDSPLGHCGVDWSLVSSTVS